MEDGVVPSRWVGGGFIPTRCVPRRHGMQAFRPFQQGAFILNQPKAPFS